MKDEFRNILHILARHRAEFIVVGGAAAVLHGAPLAAADLDIVHRRTPENLARLHSALEELHAAYRAGSEESSRPAVDVLASLRNHSLQSLHGPLDLRAALGDNQTYEDLSPHAVDIRIAGVGLVEVLDLDTLIALMRQSGQPNDILAVTVLEAMRDEKSRGSQ